MLSYNLQLEIWPSCPMLLHGGQWVGNKDFKVIGRSEFAIFIYFFYFDFFGLFKKLIFLEYGWFTMWHVLCTLLKSKVNRLYMYWLFFRFFSHIDHDRALIVFLIVSDSSLRHIILAMKWKQFFTEIMVKSDLWSSFDAWEQTAVLTHAHNTLKGFHAWDCPSVKILNEDLVFRKYWYSEALSSSSIWDSVFMGLLSWGVTELKGMREKVLKGTDLPCSWNGNTWNFTQGSRSTRPREASRMSP